ncbi:hypothetical protein D3C75_683890 [compost metagenome]
MAVFSSTAEAPISIASAASDGLPIPASTIMGRSTSEIRIRSSSLVFKPRFEPMGAPSGIIAAAPAAFIRSAADRSGLI